MCINTSMSCRNGDLLLMDKSSKQLKTKVNQIDDAEKLLEPALVYLETVDT